MSVDDRNSKKYRRSEEAVAWYLRLTDNKPLTWRRLLIFLAWLMRSGSNARALLQVMWQARTGDGIARREWNYHQHLERKFRVTNSGDADALPDEGTLGDEGNSDPVYHRIILGAVLLSVTVGVLDVAWKVLAIFGVSFPSVGEAAVSTRAALILASLVAVIIGWRLSLCSIRGTEDA